MQKIDPNKLELSLKYISRMAKGRNPFNNQPASPDDVIRDPNVNRCMDFLREILEEVRKNGGIHSNCRIELRSFPFSCLTSFQYTENKSLTLFMQQLTALSPDPYVQPLPAKPVRDWLVKHGCLEEVQNTENSRKKTMITPKGEALGLLYQDCISAHGSAYQATYYSRKAQEYLVRNMEAILQEMSANTP